jgi:hypothetical protein
MRKAAVERNQEGFYISEVQGLLGICQTCKEK